MDDENDRNMTPGPRVPPERLEAACLAILTAAGVPGDEASIVTRSLVTAEMRGVSSHGTVRLRVYVRRVRAGLIQVGAPPQLIAERPSALCFDGRGGFGHVVGARAMGACIERAEATGIAAAVVRNSAHFGMAGLFAEQASAAGMIGIAASNSAARMPPHGGRTAVLGTNPLAVAIPTPGPFPILLDMATSVAAFGKILLARNRGQSIPEGWALGLDGHPTTDPATASDGLLLPLGGPKGFGLALVIEVLSAALSGAALGQTVGSMYKTWDRPEDLGHFFAAISIAAFGPKDAFLDRIGELVAQIRNASRLPGVDGIYLPGEPEFLREAEARRSGIPLNEEQVQELRRLGVELGATVPV